MFTRGKLASLPCTVFGFKYGLMCGAHASLGPLQHAQQVQRTRQRTTLVIFRHLINLDLIGRGNESMSSNVDNAIKLLPPPPPPTAVVASHSATKGRLHLHHQVRVERL